MNYEYLAQDELDVIDIASSSEKQNFKDPIEITIKIKIERTRYNSVKKRYKTPIYDKIKDLFKPSK